MARVTVYHDNIKQMMAEIQQSFDRNGPIRHGHGSECPRWVQPGQRDDDRVLLAAAPAVA